MAGMLISTVLPEMIHHLKTTLQRTVKTTNKRGLSLFPIWIVLKPYPIYLVNKDTSATKVENGGKETLSTADSLME